MSFPECGAMRAELNNSSSMAPAQAEVFCPRHEPLVKLGIIGQVRPGSNASAKIRKDMFKSICTRVNEVNLSHVRLHNTLQH